MSLSELPLKEQVPVFRVRDGHPCRIERRSEYDALGRCTFFVDWNDDGKERAQIFFGRPQVHVSTIQLGSLWRAGATGSVYRVAEICDDADEILMSLHEMSPVLQQEIEADADREGCDRAEAVASYLEEHSMQVEAAWFQHAAVAVNAGTR